MERGLAVWASDRVEDPGQWPEVTFEAPVTMCPATPCFTFTTATGTGRGIRTAGPALFMFTGAEVGNAEPRSVGWPGSQDSATSKLRVGAEGHTGEKALLAFPSRRKNPRTMKGCKESSLSSVWPCGCHPQAAASRHAGVCLPPCRCAPPAVPVCTPRRAGVWLCSSLDSHC